MRAMKMLSLSQWLLHGIAEASMTVDHYRAIDKDGSKRSDESP